MRVSATAILTTAKPPGGEHPYALPAPPPGVVPEGAATMAQDSAITDSFAWAQQGAFGDGLGFLGYAYLSELAQRPEYRRISETIAKEMTRKWIKLQAGGEDAEEKADKLAQLEKALKRYKVQALFREVAEHDGFFGRAHIYIDTGATHDRDLLATPLVISDKTIKRGGLKALRVVEPIWTYPGIYDSANPLREDHYKPRTWYVMGQTVHASRLLTFVGREVPDLLRPAYSFGGVALSQMAKPYVDNWIRTRQSVSDLLHSFSVSGLATDLEATLTGGSGDDLVNRAQLFVQTRDNRNMMLIDKEREEFFNVSTPLSSLDLLQAQSQEHMASVSGIPLVKLLGITPSGLNASSDGEIRVFYDWIEAQQEQLFRDNLTRLLHIIQLSEFGEIDEEIDFTFEPLWSLTEKEAAEKRLIEAQTDQAYVDGAIVDPVEVRHRLAADPDPLYVGLDVEKVPLPAPEMDGPEEPAKEPEAAA